MQRVNRELVQELARRVERMESGRRPAIDGERATGIASLQGLFPHDGLPCGSLVELVAAAEGSGAWTLGLVMAVQVCARRRVMVIVDGEKQFYCPGAVRLGLELDRSIVVRPANRRDAYQAMVQALRSKVVGVVMGWQERMSMRELRRVQLAADAGGGVAILMRPAHAARGPSCASVRLLVAPVQFQTGSTGGGTLFRKSAPVRPWLRRVRVDVMRCRGRAYGESLTLEIDDEAGHVHTLASVASAAGLARSARASG